MGPLSNPVPSSRTPAYEPDEPGRDWLAGDPPVMRPADGTRTIEAIQKSGRSSGSPPQNK